MAKDEKSKALKKIVVENHRFGSLGFNGCEVLLHPGPNLVDADLWDRVSAADDSVRHYIKCGRDQMGPDKNSLGITVGKRHESELSTGAVPGETQVSISTVRNTEDIEQIGVWIETEVRKPVLETLQKRKSALLAKLKKSAGDAVSSTNSAGTETGAKV